MKECIIDLSEKSELGAAANRRYRSEGLIPAVLYHRGEEAHSALLNARQFVRAASSSQRTQVFRTKSDVSSLDNRNLLVKEIQRDYVKNAVLHVDFQILRDDEEIHLSVPLVFVGESPGVKLNGGILTVVAHEVEVSCFLKNIPDSISVDISALQVGESIHSSSLNLPEGVSLRSDEEQTIVSVVVPKASEESTAGASAAAPVAGDAAAPAAAAAAPAAEDKKPAKK